MAGRFVLFDHTRLDVSDLLGFGQYRDFKPQVLAFFLAFEDGASDLDRYESHVGLA